MGGLLLESRLYARGSEVTLSGMRIFVTFVWMAALLGASPGLTEDDDPEYEMVEYQFVLIRDADDRGSMDERAIQKVQEEHLALMDRYHRDGKILAAGPVEGHARLRMVVALDAGSVDEARAMVEADPWIASGRRVAEVLPWWAAKGILQDAPSLRRLEPAVLGLFVRPENAPELSDAELQELQAGHLANIGAIAESGDLVLAGPFGHDGRLRGMLLFRDVDLGRIQEMLARDPSVKAGRLGVELYPWRIPAGTLPPR